MTGQSQADPESGVILVNVLSIVALASAVMVAILTLQDLSIERSTRFMDAAAAGSIALGGEASATIALRRDATDAPEADHYGELWANVQDEAAVIEGGRFRLEIRDEQARFNLNNLVTDGLGAEETLRALLLLVGAPQGLASKISAFVAVRGGVRNVQELAGAGIEPAAIAALEPVVCALPGPTDINFNTADESVMAALLGNRPAARSLVSRRERNGFLTAEDLTLASVLLPPRSGFRSDYFTVSTTVTYGTVTLSIDSRLHRTRDGGSARVAVWERKRNAAAQLPEPPLSTQLAD